MHTHKRTNAQPPSMHQAWRYAGANMYWLGVDGKQTPSPSSLIASCSDGACASSSASRPRRCSSTIAHTMLTRPNATSSPGPLLFPSTRSFTPRYHTYRKLRAAKSGRVRALSFPVPPRRRHGHGGCAGLFSGPRPHAWHQLRDGVAGPRAQSQQGRLQRQGLCHHRLRHSPGGRWVRLRRLLPPFRMRASAAKEMRCDVLCLQAKANGIRLIVPLTDDYSYYHGCVHRFSHMSTSGCSAVAACRFGPHPHPAVPPSRRPAAPPSQLVPRLPQVCWLQLYRPGRAKSVKRLHPVLQRPRRDCRFQGEAHAVETPVLRARAGRR